MLDAAFLPSLAAFRCLVYEILAMVHLDHKFRICLKI